jgi:hypothetical protein
MEGGRWLWKKNPTREEIEGANILSVFKVETRHFNPRLPFYPLPFRTETGSIMFPPEINGGRYMRDDVIAALKYFDHWSKSGELVSVAPGDRSCLQLRSATPTSALRSPPTG